jgi:hypothetical protein
VPPREPSAECLQFAAALDAVLLTGRGRLVETFGTAGAGKSQLLAQCLDAARRRGFAGLSLRVDRQADGAGHPLRTLMLGLLRLDPASSSPAIAGDALAVEVRTRCQMLGLPDAHIDACLILLDDAHAWPRPTTQRVQALALCALIQLLAQHEPLVLGLDDLHNADWVLAMALEIMMPATLLLPVVWMVTSAPFAGLASPGVGARLDGVPRTTFHMKSHTGSIMGSMTTTPKSSHS